MDITQIDPALREVTRKAPRMNLENPVVLWAITSLSRFMPGAKVDGVERRIVRDGDVRARVYLPAETTGAGLLWIHGGGLVLGAAAMDDRTSSEVARETGAVVVSVDYRLAPRHPFPAAIDDCAAAFAWFVAHAGEFGVDPGRIAVGGQSAGGGLAAALTQRLVDAQTPPAAQWLFCPMLDDRTAADRARDEVDHFVWNNRANLVGWRSYLGDRVGADALPPYAAPARRDDLRGLPPTWIYTSDAELFFDEDVAYARALEDAGVPVTLDVVSGAAHGFEAWAPDTEPARALQARARAWLGARLR
ncbi:alpha/beta hydrolase [Microbacterium kyungheense]|uniref:Acetyl esterase/lipase n=1 Tax=Microbacterium kyungheense TaxID=1263636 RepID=A0A543EFB6_9MICO|nr:alpha/beta hydrolase [Microbacterium kyungheense]TQM20277.1 acetyl esterase/lipase [Microbacterium kyungheense]